MNHRISAAAFLLFAALPPIGRAAIIDVADVRLTAFASYTTQGQPDKTSSDFKIAPLHGLDRAEALVLAESVPGIPFPNVPTSQTRPFASSAADADRFFGVGVNGFFFPNALAPNALSASGTTTVSLPNNSASTFPVAVDFFIPAPILRFFGVGNSSPAGAEPAREAMASAFALGVLVLGISVHRRRLPPFPATLTRA